MPDIKNILERLNILHLIFKRMGIKAWEGGKKHQGLILIVVLYFRLIDLWKAGMPYLYYTDEWHMLQPVVYFLTNQTLNLEAFRPVRVGFTVFCQCNPQIFYALGY